jgi:hypothetical protein
MDTAEAQAALKWKIDTKTYEGKIELLREFEFMTDFLKDCYFNGFCKGRKNFVLTPRYAA